MIFVWLRKNFSAVSLFLVIAFTLFQGSRYKQWEERKLILSDVCVYYAYLPAVFIYHDLSFNFVDRLPKEPREKVFYAKLPETKRFMDKTCGVAVLVTPFFLIAHACSLAAGLPADGYTSVYEFFLFIAAIFYFSAGMIFLRKTLLLFFDQTITSFTLIAIGLATNLLSYTVYESGMTHVYSFFLFSFFLWTTIRWHEHPGWKHAALLGITTGLITLIRPTNCIVLIIPLLWNVTDLRSLKAKSVFLKNHFKNLLPWSVFFFLGILPQLLYWKYATGRWVFYSYGEQGFFFNNPHIINGLFSFHKGFFIYTPVMFLLFPGIWLALRKKTAYAIPVLLFSLVNVYIIFSWWCWVYGGSFGSRPMIDSYPLLALPLALAISYFFSRSTIIKIILTAFISGTVVLNLFQTKQYALTLLHWDGMNFKVYCKIFGSTIFPNNFETTLTLFDNESALKGLPPRKIMDLKIENLKLLYTYYAGFKNHFGHFVCDDRIAGAIVSNRNYMGPWETFTLFRYGNNVYTIRTSQNKFVGVDYDRKGILLAEKKSPGKEEFFRVIDIKENKFALRDYKGYYVSASSDSLFSLKSGADKIGPAEIFEWIPGCLTGQTTY